LPASPNPTPFRKISSETQVLTLTDLFTGQFQLTVPSFMAGGTTYGGTTGALAHDALAGNLER